MAKQRRNRDFDFSKSDVSRFDFTKDEIDELEVAPKPPTPNPEKSKWEKIIGLIKNNPWISGTAAAALVCLLGYGAYSYFNSSDEKTDDTTTEVVEGTTDTSNERDSKGQNNDQTVETPEEETAEAGSSADDEETASPAQEETSLEESSTKAEPKQDVPAKPTEPATPSGTLEEKAKDVIRGNYGNGEVRKQRLGDQYAEIQSKVNEMYRNGLVK